MANFNDKVDELTEKILNDGENISYEDHRNNPMEYVRAAEQALVILSNQYDTSDLLGALKLESQYEDFDKPPPITQYMKFRSRFFKSSNPNRKVDARVLAHATGFKITAQQVRDRSWYNGEGSDDSDFGDDPDQPSGRNARRTNDQPNNRNDITIPRLDTVGTSANDRVVTSTIQDYPPVRDTSNVHVAPHVQDTSSFNVPAHVRDTSNVHDASDVPGVSIDQLLHVTSAPVDVLPLLHCTLDEHPEVNDTPNVEVPGVVPDTSIVQLTDAGVPDTTNVQVPVVVPDTSNVGLPDAGVTDTSIVQVPGAVPGTPNVGLPDAGVTYTPNVQLPGDGVPDTSNVQVPEAGVPDTSIVQVPGAVADASNIQVSPAAPGTSNIQVSPAAPERRSIPVRGLPSRKDETETGRRNDHPSDRVRQPRNDRASGKEQQPPPATPPIAFEEPVALLPAVEEATVAATVRQSLTVSAFVDFLQSAATNGFQTSTPIARRSDIRQADNENASQPPDASNVPFSFRFEDPTAVVDNRQIVISDMQQILSDVVNGLSPSEIFKRDSAINSNRAFYTFCVLWNLGILTIEQNPDLTIRKIAIALSVGTDTVQ